MKEVLGDLWSFHGKENYVCCITTNGFVKKNGEAVMGRGCALEAVSRYPKLATLLGASILEHGNKMFLLLPEDGVMLIAFPVKHNWYEEADFLLIAESAHSLAMYARLKPEKTFILPRPGCGNGKLSWQIVKGIIKDILPDNVWIISPRDL